MRMEFDIFWQTLKFVLEGMEIPRDKWYFYILQQLGREGMEQWTTNIKASVNKEDPIAIITAFKKGYELEETYWTYQSLYLSSEKQGRGNWQPLSPPGLKTWSVCASGWTIRRRKGT